MRAAAILAQAETALAEGDLPRARALVDDVLAQKPRHAGALELRNAIDELAPFHDPAEPAQAQDFGDLRPDARHAMPPAAAGPLPGVHAAPREARPVGVTLLALFVGFVGAVTLLLGLLVGTPIGLMLDLLGLSLLAGGVGLWKLRAWGWTLTLVVTAIGLVLNVGSALAGEGRAFVVALLQGGILAYLWVVRDRFRAAPATRAPSRRLEA